MFGQRIILLKKNCLRPCVAHGFGTLPQSNHSRECLMQGDNLCVQLPFHRVKYARTTTPVWPGNSNAFPGSCRNVCNLDVTALLTFPRRTGDDVRLCASAAYGHSFGIAPAWITSQTDPVDALRMECAPRVREPQSCSGH
jgi:hypothetical protein